MGRKVFPCRSLSGSMRALGVDVVKERHCLQAPARGDTMGADEEASKKFEKGGDDDISKGPVEKRAPATAGLRM